MQFKNQEFNPIAMKHSIYQATLSNVLHQTPCSDVTNLSEPTVDDSKIPEIRLMYRSFSLSEFVKLRYQGLSFIQFTLIA